MKKAYLSIGALLTVLALSGCNPQESSSQSTGGGSSSEVSSSSQSSSSTIADVFTYELSIETPEKTVFEVGDVFDFQAIAVKLTTYKNGTKDGGEKTLARSEYVVKVNGSTIEGNFTFASAGEVTFVISSSEHEEATASFKLTAIQRYTITNASSDKVVLTSLPETALEGEKISFGLKLLPGYYFEGEIHILDGEGEEIDYTDEGSYNYSFTMPASNVSISVGSELTDFTISKDDTVIGDILPEDAEDDYEKGSVFSAVAGTRLKFQTLENIDWTYSKVFLGKEELTKGDDGYYHFVMPHHPAKISTDKINTEYEISSNASELELTTTKIYTDPETKEEITTAHKGQTVYVKFSYEVVLVKYKVSASDANGNSIEIKVDETDPTLFSFTMISSKITLKITEDNWSKYDGYYVTDKTWYTTSVSKTNTDPLKTFTYSQLTSGSYAASSAWKFLPNGKGSKGSTEISWSTSADETSGKLLVSYGSVTDKEIVYTPHLFVTKTYDSTYDDWTSARIGTWDENTTIHTICLPASYNRLIWTQDDEGNITEKIFVTASGATYDFNLYTDSTKETLVNGNDITSSLNGIVETGSGETYEILNGTFVKSYNLTATTSSQYTIACKNEAGETITSAKNSEKVYIYGTLADGVDTTTISIKEPVVEANGKKTTVTAVEGNENAWYFTMPEGDVTISLKLSDANKMLGHASLGNYIGFNLCSSYDKDFSKYDPTNYAVLQNGTFKIGNSTTYDILSFDTTARGSMVIEEGSTNRTWYYGGSTMSRMYSNKTNDVYVLVRLSDEQDYKKVKTHTHWMSSGTSWGIEFYYTNTDDTISTLGSIFMTNDTFYNGIDFEMSGTSTRIGDGATYNVKLDGETIYTVANNTVTAA